MDNFYKHMKKIAFILSLTLTLGFLSCKEEPKGDLIKGEFVYLADAAVFQTDQEIYGVIIDEKMHELDDMVQKYKKEDTDMVPVEIRAIKTPKPEGEEGWDYRLQVTEIINVFEPNAESNSVIKIGS